MAKKKKISKELQIFMDAVDKTSAEVQKQDEELRLKFPEIEEQQKRFAELLKPSLEESERLANLIAPDPALLESLKGMTSLALQPAIDLGDTFARIHQQNMELASGIADIPRRLIDSLDLSGFAKSLQMDWGTVENSLVSSLPEQLDIHAPVYEVDVPIVTNPIYELIDEVRQLRQQFERVAVSLERDQERQLSPQSTSTVESLKDPLDEIPDIGWQLDAVRLWNSGKTYAQVADLVDRHVQTVTNKISQLRKDYPHLVKRKKK